MPDTGAPWNIPYVAGTDLVSDWPTDSLALANAIAAGLDLSKQIKQRVVSTDTTDRNTTSNTFVDASISVTITPTAASNLIVVNWTGAGIGRPSGGATRVYMRLYNTTASAALQGAENLQWNEDGGGNMQYGFNIVGIFTSAGTTAQTIRGEFSKDAVSGTATIYNTITTGVLTAWEIAV